MNLAQSGPSLAGTAPSQAPAPSATTAQTAEAGTPTVRQQAPGMEMLWLFGPVVLVMIVVSIFSGRKQRKQKDAMLASLRKHDRVVTTSGLIGFVSEVKQDTVVLKIEEGRDVRLTFTRDAIAAVVKAAPAGAEASRSDE